MTADDVELVEPELDDAFTEILSWADDARRLGVRANADTAEDAARAREFGAEGIGLCRTEHMFFGADREALVRDMFVAGERARARARGAVEAARSRTPRPYAAALARLAEMQRSDFVALLGAMEGAPVTIRLLDPPLHEFIGPAAFEGELADAEARGDAEAAAEARERIAIARELEEVNPMLGTRGARLGLHLGGLYEMQARAIAEAALAVAGDGDLPEVEVMIPLVAFATELRALRGTVEGISRRGPRAADAQRRDDDRAPRRLHGRRPDCRGGGLLQLRHQRSRPRPPSGSRATMPSADSCPATSRAGSSRAAPSRRSTSRPSAASSGSPRSAAGRRSPA